MPTAQEHACSIRDKSDFEADSIKRTNREHEGKEYAVLFGRLKGKDTTAEYEYLYDKDIWSASEAKKHCEDHDGTFSKALKEDKKDADEEKYNCECVDCGYQIESEEHCKDIKCPECGGEMRRVERPGPGQKKEKPIVNKKSYNRSPFKPRGRVDLKIMNKDSEDEATIYIYDEISWFGISAEEFIRGLNDIKAKTIHIRLNTPGGSVFDGTAIFNAIKQHKSHTITHIDGLAASFGSVIALAGDEIRMAKNAFLMIHDPWSMVIGTADTMRQEADLLDKIGGVIADTYMDKTGKTDVEIKKLMNAETWMTAEEAMEMGFVDEIEDEKKDEKAKASLFDLSIFANVPDELRGIEKDLTEREAEKALRDAGFSRTQSKEILAKGFQPERDAQVEPVKTDVRDAQMEDEPPLRDAGQPNDEVMELLTRADVVMAH